MKNHKKKNNAVNGKAVRQASELNFDNSLFSYDELFSHTKLGIYRNTPGPKGHFLQANASLVRMFEARSKDDFLRHNVSDLYENPADRAAVSAKILKNGYVESELLRLETLKGRKILCEVTAVMRKDASGNIYFDGMIENVTERKALEKKLETTAASLRVAQHMANLGSWELDLVNNKLTWSDEIYRIFEIDPKKFGASYEAFLETVHPEDRKAVDSAYTNSIKTKTPYRIEHRLLFSDGRVKYVEEQCRTEFNENGKALLSIGTVQDISERKIAEQKIERLVSLYRALSECNQAVMRSKNEAELFLKICRSMVQFGGMQMAWIGLVDPKTKLISVDASAGKGIEYLKGIKISASADTEFGCGPTGTAIREKRPFWCQDFMHDPATKPWKKRGSKYGWKSSAALPIYRGGDVVGAITLYADEVKAFDVESRRLLTEVASDLGRALDTFDIEGRRELAEKNLRESEARYRKLIETEPECVKLLSKDNILLDMNSAGLAMIGADSLQQVAGKSVIGIIDPEYRDIFRGVTSKVFKGMEASAQFRITGLKGGKRWLETHAVPLLDEKGSIHSLLSVTRDITEQKAKDELLNGRVEELERLKKSLTNLLEDLGAKEEEIELEKMRYEVLLGNMSDGVIAVDMDDRITYVNDVAARIVGYDAKYLIGKNSLEMWKLADYETGAVMADSDRPLSVATRKKGKIFSRYILIGGKGRKVPISATVAPIVSGGRIIGANAVIRDITLEAEVDRAKNEFISVASHQMRTPLGSMKWLIEALMSDANIDEKSRAKLQSLFVSNERLIALINDLLSISRMESGKSLGEKKSFNMADLIKDVAEDFKDASARTGKKMVISVPSKVRSVVGNSALVAEAFRNILANAVTYGEKNSAISVKMAPVDDSYLVSVNNAGKGISAEDRDKIFTKFFRAPSAKLIKPEGSGLGLYIAKTSVEKNGGKIWFESDDKNGTTFYFTVPFSAA